MPIIESDAFHNVKGNGIFQVVGIKINDIFYSFLRDKVQQIVGGVAVRVNKADASSGLYVLDGHILQKLRLTHPGRTDHVHMAPSVVFLYAKSYPIAPEIRLTKEHYFFFVLNILCHPIGNPAGGSPFLASTLGSSGDFTLTSGK